MLRRNRRGAATAEYILLLSIGLGLLLLMFWRSLAGVIGSRLYEMGIDVPVLRNIRPANKPESPTVEAEPETNAPGSGGVLSHGPGVVGTGEVHSFPGGRSSGEPIPSTETFKNR